MNSNWMQHALKRGVDAYDGGRESETEQHGRGMLAKKPNGKMLRIIVRSAEGDKVNIKLPIGLGLSILRKGSKHVSFNNKAFDEVDIEDLESLIQEGAIGEIVNVESSEGDTVKIIID